MVDLFKYLPSLEKAHVHRLEYFFGIIIVIAFIIKI